MKPSECFLEVAGLRGDKVHEDTRHVRKEMKREKATLEWILQSPQLVSHMGEIWCLIEPFTNC